MHNVCASEGLFDAAVVDATWWFALDMGWIGGFVVGLPRLMSRAAPICESIEW